MVGTPITMEGRPKRNVIEPKPYMTSEKLIDAVEKHRLLWDKTHPKYKDRAARSREWNDISRGFVGGSPADCKSTWESLCRGRRNNIKAREAAEMSGAAAHRLKPYVHEERMSFVKITPTHQKIEGNLQLTGKRIEIKSIEHLEAESESESEDDSDSDTKDVLQWSMNQELNQYWKHSFSNDSVHPVPFKMSPVTSSPLKDVNRNICKLEDQQSFGASSEESAFGSNKENIVPSRLKTSSVGGVGKLKLNTKKKLSPVMENGEDTEFDEGLNKENKPKGKKKVKTTKVPKKAIEGSEAEDQEEPDAGHPEMDADAAKEIKRHQKLLAREAFREANRDLMKSKIDLQIAKQKLMEATEAAKKPTPSVQQGNNACYSMHGGSGASNLEIEVQKDLICAISESKRNEDWNGLFCMSFAARLRELTQPLCASVHMLMMQIITAAEQKGCVPHLSGEQPQQQQSPKTLSSLTTRKEPLYPLLLDSDTQKYVQKLFELDASEVVVSDFGVSIYGSDIGTLAGDEWLNDKIIEFYMKLMNTSNSNNKGRIYVCNTFFFSQLFSAGYESVQEWMTDADIFTYDTLFVPVHLGNHWTLLICNFRSKEIVYYDSLGGKFIDGPERILRYLGLRSDKSGGRLSTGFCALDWTVHYVQEPAQKKSCDCGVFILAYVGSILEGLKPNFSQEDIPSIRKVIAYEIATKSRI